MTLLGAAVVCAFVRARYDMLARRQRTADEPEQEGKPYFGRARESTALTAEGRRFQRRGRQFRLLLYLFGLGALLATLFRL
jgi:hypothetical protein